MRRRIVIILVVLMGIVVLAYPSLSNYLAEKNGSRAIANYQEEVSAYDPDALAQAWAEAEEYNESLTGSPVHDPFVEGTGMAMPADYARVLNISDTMGFIEIPKINVNLPIYHGTSEDVLQRGIGHLEGSTMPIGGTSRHTVLTGHTGLTHAKLFTDLVELEEGDLFFIQVLDQTLAYQVDQIKVIEPSTTDDLKRVAGRDYCTLLTCTPYGVNSHRLLVRGVRVPYSPEVHDSIDTVVGSEIDLMVWRAALITAAVMAVLIIITLITSRRKKDNPKRVAQRAEANSRKAKPRHNSPPERE